LVSVSIVTIAKLGRISKTKLQESNAEIINLL